MGDDLICALGATVKVAAPSSRAAQPYMTLVPSRVGTSEAYHSLIMQHQTLCVFLL